MGQEVLQVEMPGVETKVEVPPAIEPPKEAPKAPERDPNAVRFSALAKREKTIVRRQQELKAEQERFAQTKTQVETQRQALDIAKTDPLKAMELLGWTYDQVTQFVINNKQIPPDKHVLDVQKKVDALEKAREDEKKQALEDEKERIAQESLDVINGFKQNLNQFIEGKKDQYELVNLHGAQESVFQAIEMHFEQTGKVLSMEEAAGLIEEQLEEDIMNSVKTKKLASRFKTEEPKKEPVPKSESKTLNNSMTPMAGPHNMSAKSEDDRMKRAMAALDVQVKT